MTTPRIYHLKGERPTQFIGIDGVVYYIPADWQILNAPRPLYGSFVNQDIPACWEGDFRHGVFYAALAPTDLKHRKLDADLDAWMLVYHTEAEINAWVANHYAKSLGEKFILEEYDQADLDMSFFLHHNGR